MIPLFHHLKQVTHPRSKIQMWTRRIVLLLTDRWMQHTAKTGEFQSGSASSMNWLSNNEPELCDSAILWKSANRQIDIAWVLFCDSMLMSLQAIWSREQLSVSNIIANNARGWWAHTFLLLGRQVSQLSCTCAGRLNSCTSHWTAKYGLAITHPTSSKHCRFVCLVKEAKVQPVGKLVCLGSWYAAIQNAISDVCFEVTPLHTWSALVGLIKPPVPEKFVGCVLYQMRICF